MTTHRSHRIFIMKMQKAAGESLEYQPEIGQLEDTCRSLCAMLNRQQTGTVIFGISDDGEVLGQSANEYELHSLAAAVTEAISPRIEPIVRRLTVEDHVVISIEVKGTQLPYCAFGRYYLRVGCEDRELTSEQLKIMFLNQDKSSTWEREDSGLSLEDVDIIWLKQFHEDAIKAGRLPRTPFEPEALLRNLGLYTGEHLNQAGRLLFGKGGQLTLKMAIFATDAKLTFLDMHHLEGHIFELLDRAERYILQNIHWRVEIRGFTRQEIPEVPVEVVRELLSNSFAHALYQANTTHEIDIHPGLIAIYNPGTFAAPHSPSAYITQNLPSVLRNERIAKTLYLGKRIEEFGSGLKRIHGWCEAQGIHYSFKNSDLGFKAEIYRTPPITGTVNDALLDTLNGTQLRVLAMLRQDHTKNREDIARRLGLTVRTVQRALNALRTAGLIERSGARKNGSWLVH